MNTLILLTALSVPGQIQVVPPTYGFEFGFRQNQGYQTGGPLCQLLFGGGRSQQMPMQHQHQHIHQYIPPPDGGDDNGQDDAEKLLLLLEILRERDINLPIEPPEDGPDLETLLLLLQLLKDSPIQVPLPTPSPPSPAPPDNGADASSADIQRLMLMLQAQTKSVQPVVPVTPVVPQQPISCPDGMRPLVIIVTPQGAVTTPANPPVTTQ